MTKELSAGNTSLTSPEAAVRRARSAASLLLHAPRVSSNDSRALAALQVCIFWVRPFAVSSAHAKCDLDEGYRRCAEAVGTRASRTIGVSKLYHCLIELNTSGVVFVGYNCNQECTTVRGPPSYLSQYMLRSDLSLRLNRPTTGHYY